MLCFALLSLSYLPIAILDETCDEKCKFTDRYITPESIRNWPVTCKKVCGNIFINVNTSLTEKQLKEKFNKLTDLVGNIEIQYTNFTSLNFLAQKLNIYPGMNGVAIRLNANLTNATAIGSWTAKEWTRWHIYYNPKLDMEPFCDRALKVPNMDFNVYGNLKNCGCKNIRIGPSSLASYSNCTSIDGGVQNGLQITQVNDSMDLSALLKLQSITGRLEIYETNLTSLSFLDNLEIINMTSSKEMNIIDIWSNSKLTRLGFGSLKNLLPGSQKLRISFAFNNPALCLTTNELQLLAEHKVDLYIDPALNLCPDLNRKDGEKVCKFDKLESLEADCQHVMGDVLVDSSNEKFASNLGNVSNIYGSLIVKGTKELTDLDFLGNLQQVANFTVDRNNPLIQISSNKKLQSVALPSMKFPLYPYSKDLQVIKINDNTLDIFKDPEQCKKLEKSTKTEIEYNGKGCDPNCTFNASFVASANLNKFPKNCSTVCASPLYIGSGTDLTEKQLTNAFKNMKNLIGELIVNGSKFKSGKVLASLETIDCDNTGFFQWSSNDNLTEVALPNLKTVACRVKITSNKKLTNLNLPKMVPTPNQFFNDTNFSRIDVEISNNSTDLCITIQEMANLLTEENVDIGLLPQKYCNTSNTSNSTDKICGFENSTMAAMESGCVQVRGDIFIGPDEEEFAHKLESVTSIFGTLVIDGTNLTNIDFLGGLERVITLNNNLKAILIQYNQDLVNVSFPNLKKVYSTAPNPIMFLNNSEELSKDPETCFSIRTVLNISDSWVPTFDGQQCEDIKKVAVAQPVRDKYGIGSFDTFQYSLLLVVVLFD